MAERWGIVTTLKAPEEQALAFVAHHLALGPDRIWLHFDDPADPAAEKVEALGVDRIRVIRCDDIYWSNRKGTENQRPDAHQRRQVTNLRRIYRREGAEVDWIAHIDVDEFLVLDRPLQEIFDACETEYLRVEPYEALHDPGLGDDIFSSRYFHRATRSGEEGRALEPVFGRYAGILQKGMLSHVAGKCFFRTGLEAFKPAIHSAKLMDDRLTVKGFSEGVALLHFHAQDPERWVAGLDYRLAKGAYRNEPALRDFLTGATDEEITDFYMTIMLARPELVAAMEAQGMLRRETLHLRAKIAALREAVRPPAVRPA
ncbi:glycosyltransferase family 2 protein [Acidimangrovimonas sediminis]|uniref:glycosyltransferase family 2 protein n=1 Tax=Acidimangrovimonas sediminis TaxID=2056283 RepID=UPI000C7FA6C6|nr:glycosyltransferase family 2 protein [Acidimangrovimonas sediminis]